MRGEANGAERHLAVELDVILLRSPLCSRRRFVGRRRAISLIRDFCCREDGEGSRYEPRETEWEDDH